MGNAERVIMNRAARKALARKWFMQGFRLSGQKFHGELHDPDRYPAVESMLGAEFDRIYKEESNDAYDQPARRNVND